MTATPTNPEPLEICIADGEDPADPESHGHLRATSREEIRYALPLRVAEGVDEHGDDDEIMATWRACLLNTSCTFKKVDSTDELFWKGLENRE
eukprot:2603767-Pyramimonas_sp.AAC.1